MDRPVFKLMMSAALIVVPLVAIDKVAGTELV